MNLFRLLALSAALLPCVSGAAINVISQNWRTGSGLAVGTTNPITFAGTLAPIGQGIVAVGIFGSTDDQISAGGSNPALWATVAASFHQFGASATMGAGLGAQPGLFQITPDANVLGTNFSGKNVYVVVGSGASLAASRFCVVFKSNTMFADEPIPNVTASLSDPLGAQAPDGQILLGTLSQGTQVWYTTGPLVDQQLSAIAGAIVPEPAAALLALFGLGLIAPRRRSPGRKPGVRCKS